MDASREVTELIDRWQKTTRGALGYGITISTKGGVVVSHLGIEHSEKMTEGSTWRARG